jgi:hypothetical protein
MGVSAVGLLIWSGLLLSIPARPTYAQFATNTPDSPTAPTLAPDQATVTLVPRPTVTLEVRGTTAPTGDGPQAPLEDYALRMWTEADYLDLLYTQINALRNGDVTARSALQLTAYELERNFPGAPTQPNARQNLIQVMLQAPRGQVDMRWLVRPYIMAELGTHEPNESFEFNNFMVELTLARFNADERPDALLHIRYPANEDDPDRVLYEEYLMVTGSETGYTLLPEAFDLPAAPLDPVQSLTLERLDDMNADTLDDVVLIVDDGEVNALWTIITNRSNRMTDPVDPNYEIRVGELISWEVTADSPNIPVLRVRQFQGESFAPNWDCRSEIAVEWRYANNYYHPTIQNGNYTAQDSLGCRLLAAEPLFAQSPTDAIETVQSALIDYTLDAPDSSRALMVLSMLYALNGQLTEARAAADAVKARAADDPWATAQSTAFLEALDISSNTALDICEALTRASEDPACDIDSVLERYLKLTPLTTDSDLLTQLETLGFTPLESAVVTEVGKAARTVVRFDYANSGWWAFAAQRDGTYSVERADISTGGSETTTEEDNTVALPQSALTSLLVDNNPRAALDIIESALQNTGGRELSGELRFARALSLELIGDRTGARRVYYNLWESSPSTLWGQLAGAHLENRTAAQ